MNLKKVLDSCDCRVVNFEVPLKPDIDLPERSERFLKDLLLKYKKNYLVQDAVKQHPAMARLNPDSINTLRIVTFRSGMEVVVCYVAIRIGRNGQVIDNESAGGMSAKVNFDGTLKMCVFCSWTG